MSAFKLSQKIFNNWPLLGLKRGLKPVAEFNTCHNLSLLKEDKQNNPKFKMSDLDVREEYRRAVNEKKAWPYIAPFEVVVHNQPDDCWVSFLGKVCDITQVINEFNNQECVKPLVAYAGKDISQWFDENTGDIQYRVHPVTGVKIPYCPHGLLPHVHPHVPTTEWRPVDVPWWRDEKYQVGLLTKRVRPVRIINALIAKEVTINVCCEDTISRILERYSLFNSDATSYTWRFNDRNLIMHQTLEENGIPDERDDFADLGLPPSLYTPGIFVYYNDDLKWEDQDCL